jgi:hypothetical protein
MQDMEMDGLAKMVGLDIEAIAIEVATKDTNWEDEKPHLSREARGIESVNSTPNEPIKPVAKAVTTPIAPNHDIFSPDKINSAFANLFGGGAPV